MSSTDALDEARRIMTICNACRYCEGICAVFPAMEMRTEFSEGDLNYLANLCHDCGACYYDCQYAPPHEFEVNVPKTLAVLRARSYHTYAWPGSMGRLFTRGGLAAAFAAAGGMVLAFLLTVLFGNAALLFAAPEARADFFAVFPHGAMVAVFGLAGLWVFVALAIGVTRFWRHMGEGPRALADGRAVLRGLWDVLTLRYLDGGGGGCMNRNEYPSVSRRVFHHLTFYGFLLCLAATGIATVYHYGFGWVAPYGYFSLPVVLGTLGGIGLVIGPAGLLWAKLTRDTSLLGGDCLDGDIAFIVLLLLSSLSGLVLLAFRETPAMGALLAVHMGIVLALFVVFAYGKFVHGLYRLAAVLRYAIEQRRGPPPDAVIPQT